MDITSLDHVCYGTVPGQKFYENCILVENIVFWLNACVPIQDQS